MIPVSSIQLRILRALAKYRFLTNSQLLKLDLGTKSKSTIWKHTNILRSKSRGYIDHISYGTIIRLGRVENVLYLTRKGKRLLIDELGMKKDEIQCPIGRPQLTDDYYHRIQTINFHIELESRMCDQNFRLEFFHPYFVRHKRGKNFQSITAIDLNKLQRIVPDAAFEVSKDGRSRFFLFELHNGRSIKRLKDQIFNHAIALTKRRTHQMFGIPNEQFYYVLIVLENPNAMEALIEEMRMEQTTYSNIHQFFLCKSLSQFDDLAFWTKWKSILGEEEQIEI